MASKVNGKGEWFEDTGRHGSSAWPRRSGARGPARRIRADRNASPAKAFRAGDATALARRYVERFGVSALYIADLDAIERRAPQHAVVRTIASVGVPVWLDAGIASSDDAQQALECGASRVIVGLETLPSFEVLESIVQSGRARASGVQSRPPRRSTDRDNARTGAAESRRPGGSSSGCGRQCDADARPCASGFRLGSRSGTARTHSIRRRQSLCMPEAVFAVSTTSSNCEGSAAMVRWSPQRFSTGRSRSCDLTDLCPLT